MQQPRKAKINADYNPIRNSMRPFTYTVFADEHSRKLNKHGTPVGSRCEFHGPNIRKERPGDVKPVSAKFSGWKSGRNKVETYF